MAGLLLLAAAWGGLRAELRPPLLGPSGGPVEVDAVVAERFCGGEDAICRVRLEGVRVDGVGIEGPVALMANARVFPELVPGAAVRVRGELEGRSPRANPGAGGSLPAHDLRWRLRGIRSVERLPGSGSLRALARTRLSRALTLADEQVTLLYRALLAGDRGDIPSSFRAAFEDTGTAHLLAISGLHLALVGWGIYRVLLLLVLMVPRFAQGARPPAIAAALALLLTWLFVAVVARSEATIRAAILLTLIFGGAVIARRPLGVRSLALAAAAIELVEPGSALGPSFQLSFAAALALVLLHVRLGHLREWAAEPGRFEHARWAAAARWLGGLVAATTASFLATAPLALAWFGQLAPVGLAVNLAVVPLVAVLVVPVGFAWLMVALLSAPLADLLASVPVAAGHLLLDTTQTWARWAGSSYAPSWSPEAGLVGSLAVLLALAPGRWRLLAPLAALGCIGLALPGSAPSPGTLRMTAIDVGHGDALLFQLPEGATMLVDTGGSWHGERADEALARYRLASALSALGVDHLDLLVISHADPDHFGAAAPLLERVRVDEVWIPPCAAADRALAAFAERVVVRGGRARIVSRDEPTRWAGAELTVLWPPPEQLRPDGTCRSSPNDGSIVLSVGYAGRRILLTGDIEAGTEAHLVAALGASGGLRADVLKVPHHGSRTSSTPGFLDAVRPDIAIVSGILRSGPMPPHLSVLGRLQRRCAGLWVTGHDGAVTVEIASSGRIRVRARGSGRVATSP